MDYMPITNGITETDKIITPVSHPDRTRPLEMPPRTSQEFQYGNITEPDTKKAPAKEM